MCRIMLPDYGVSSCPSAMGAVAMLALGFVLGMRHATDADHVVAVSAIVIRERSLRAAAPIGALWGLGHTLTILIVGGAIIVFGVVIPPRVGLGLELCVALMLVILGGLNIRGVLRSTTDSAEGSVGGPHAHPHEGLRRNNSGSIRPLAVGIVHGLAGSAAVALLVLGAISSAAWAACYLLVFGIGTVAGMILITFAMALSISLAARGFDRLHRLLGLATGLAGVIFGMFLVYQIGFVHGLFTAHANWTPQ